VDADRLLQPSLTHHGAPIARLRPWALSGQRYVALFGGALAFGIIGALNTRRLGLPRAAAYKIAGIALGLEAVMLVLVIGVLPMKAPPLLITGLVAYWCSSDLQVTPDRVYHYYTRVPDPYDRLDDPGAAACFAGRGFEIALLVALVP
jgi:hypothetical protein